MLKKQNSTLTNNYMHGHNNSTMSSRSSSSMHQDADIILSIRAHVYFWFCVGWYCAYISKSPAYVFVGCLLISCGFFDFTFRVQGHNE